MLHAPPSSWSSSAWPSTRVETFDLSGSLSHLCPLYQHFKCARWSWFCYRGMPWLCAHSNPWSASITSHQFWDSTSGSWPNHCHGLPSLAIQSFGTAGVRQDRPTFAHLSRFVHRTGRFELSASHGCWCLAWSCRSSLCRRFGCWSSSSEPLSVYLDLSWTAVVFTWPIIGFHFGASTR